jgi:hypothetical protein
MHIVLVHAVWWGRVYSQWLVCSKSPASDWRPQAQGSTPPSMLTGAAGMSKRKLDTRTKRDLTGIIFLLSQSQFVPWVEEIWGHQLEKLRLPSDPERRRLLPLPIFHSI